MENKINEKLNYSESAKKRGIAFINAAILIGKFSFDNNNTDNDKKTYIEDLNNLKKIWENGNNHDENLQKLLGYLCKKIQKSIPYYKGFSLKKIFQQLKNADNHYTWENNCRNELKEITYIGTKSDGTRIYQVRTDRPIQDITESQTKKWLSIIDSDIDKQPKWFKKLDKWEQGHLQSRIKEWNDNKNERQNQNLGAFLGVPPTTIRGSLQHVINLPKTTHSCIDKAKSFL